MSNKTSDDKPKAWIYRGVYRHPLRGEWFVPRTDVPSGENSSTSKHVHLRDDVGCFGPQSDPMERHILEPIPDDVVMVPREKIEALRTRMLRWHLTIAKATDAEMVPAIDAILACAEQPKPKDEILEAQDKANFVIEAQRRIAAIKEDRVLEALRAGRGYMSVENPSFQFMTEAIVLRERELEEHK